MEISFDLQGIGKAAVHVACDVSRRQDVDAMVGEAVKAYGRIREV